MMTLRRPPRRGFSGNPFTPAELFCGGVNGVWFDPSDLGTMFQDAARTTPVTAADQPVGRILDKSGNGNHASQTTSSKRPMLRSDGRLWWLEFDGVDDALATSTIILPTTNKLSAFVASKKINSTQAFQVIAEYSNDININVGAFAIYANSSSGANDYAIGLRASGNNYCTLSQYQPPITNVITALFDIGGSTIDDEIVCTINRKVPATRVNAGFVNADDGNFGSYQLYLGARGMVLLPFYGNLYGLVICSDKKTNSVAGFVEKYLAAKSGVVF